MLGLRFIGNREVKLEEFPRPTASASNVVVKVRASALCGTDLPFYRAPKDILGCIPGHEISGEVVEIDKATNVREGDRVILNTQIGCGHCDECRRGQVLFCGDMRTMGVTPGFNGGHAEYVLVPEKDCLPLPQEIPFDVGSVIPDGVGVPYHVLSRMGVTAMDSVAVFGAGPIGLGMILLLKFLGAFVIAVEINEFRRDLAKQLGADVVIDPSREDVLGSINQITKGRGVDKALDCAPGTEVTTNQAVASVKKGGKVAFIGEKERVCLEDLREMVIHKEVQIIGSCGYNLGEYGQLIRLVQSGLGIEQIITHRFTLQEAAEAFRVFDSGNTGKVVIVR